jgi:transposase
MKFSNQEIEIKNLDHLGIVAGIIDEIGLVEKINELLGTDSREKINCGEVVKAIILNGLGFVSQPLYLFPHFFKDKAVEHLLGKGIKAADLNDDKLGRVMDRLYKFGLSKIFFIIGMDTVQKYTIETKYSHLDSSSMHLHGQYNNRPNQSLTEPREVMGESPIIITHGYSRDHRPDLKQCMIDLIVSGDGDIPLFFRGGSGNESDKAIFGKILVEYSRQIDFESIMVADSALYTANNLKKMGKMKWITRVPSSIKAAKNLIKTVASEKLKPSNDGRYKYLEHQAKYAGVEQRWLLVESEERKKSDLKKIEKNIDKELIKLNKEISKIGKKEFESKVIGEKEIAKIKAKLKYHQLVDLELVEREVKDKGKSYRILVNIIKNQQAIEECQNGAGRFILGTNIMDSNDLSSQEILAAYKEQQASERGFGFLKDPLFFADSLFLKNPERIETMMMLMGLCLLVYKIGERQLRATLQAKKSFVKNQLNKLVNRPTLRWIFQCFTGIHILTMAGIERIINLTEERLYILQFLPESCQKYYCSC